MRIIAGEFGGRVIDSPSERTTRPTTDRVRESIFSSVYSRLPDLADVIVLDAFAGSGALGIEALSRGAASCTFVECDRAARAVLEKNLSTLGLKAPRVRVIAGDVFEAAERHALVPSAVFRSSCSILPTPSRRRLSVTCSWPWMTTASLPMAASSSTSTPSTTGRRSPRSLPPVDASRSMARRSMAKSE